MGFVAQENNAAQTIFSHGPRYNFLSAVVNQEKYLCVEMEYTLPQ